MAGGCGATEGWLVTVAPEANAVAAWEAEASAWT